MLVGRDAELAELESRTRTNRLTTVVGPGGVGKTALAEALAERVRDSYPLGAREVDLTRVEDDEAVAGALASQLGFDSFDALLSAPNDRPVLLVVDNCEHLLDATAGALVRLLGACQQATIVATSRSPLELPGESIVSLAPLGVPLHGSDPTASPSVQLFLQRARDAGATVVDDDLEVVAELCRRLDGLPLALEIAAARARTMSMTEIAERLTDTIEVLDRPRFRGDPRHRSIADTIRWSYDLLAPSQAVLLERLAVFAGPFTAASALAFAGDGAPSFDADLDELVNASLVAVDDRAGATRYRLLDTVRRFALDRLRRRGALEQTYDQFVDHVVRSVQRIVAGATTSWRPALVRDLVEASDDMAEALTYAIGHDRTPDRAYRLCALSWAIVHQAHADEIATLCRRTLQRWPADGSPTSAQTVAALATAEYVTGQPERAVKLAEPALAELTRPTIAAITLHRVLGQARRALGDLEGSVDIFRGGARIGHELGMTAMALELDIAAALVTADLGHVDRAVAELHVVLERASAVESAITDCWARAALGWVLLRRDPSEARHVIDAALGEARRIDYPIAVAVGLRSRAYAFVLVDEVQEAVAAASELLGDLLRRGALSNSRLLIDLAAVIAHRCGHPSWERLAATARSLPITSLVAAGYELVPLPATTAAPLPRHEGVVTVRHVLTELASSTLVPTRDAGADAPTTTAPSVRRLGDVWEFSYGNQSVAVRTSKGVVDIVRLIEANGAEVHCLDLAGAGVQQASTGETIDTTARHQYEQRIRELQADIDDAEADSDYERAYRHQVELDTLIEHLADALGRGSRTRRAADTAERARSAVTHRVRTTIRQVSKLHPRLGSHLTVAINTGTYCSYRPEQPVTWDIDRGGG